MKKIILTLLFVAGVLSAGAWNKISYPALVSLTAKHLTAETAGAIKSVLGGDLAASKIVAQPLCLLYLNEEYVPMAKGEHDVLATAKMALERLKSDKNDAEALSLLARAVVDMHGVANVRIEGNSLSDGAFTVRRWNNRNGKMARYKDCTWKFLWNSYYAYRREVFTSELYAEDIDIFHRSRLDEFKKGSIDDWAADMAAEIKVIYSRNLTDNYILGQEDVNHFEYTHDRLFAKAAYRLAALLNEIYR